MKKTACALFLLGLALAGCKGMEESKLPDLVGNKDTKAYYKNVPDHRNKIPEDKRVFFKNMDEAVAAGYHNSQEGTDAPAEDAK